MGVGNSLVQNREAKLTFEYETNGEKVKLSPATVRNYLVSGGGNVSDQEVMMFMTLCKYQHLNPFLREAYLIKYGTSPATIVTGKDVFTKRARMQADYAGKKSGIIVVDDQGNVIEREGTFYLPTERLVGGWAKIYIKGYDTPEYMSVAFEEYVGKKKDGTVNEQWTKKPATMIRKVAVVQALREAFPDTFKGLYSQEEIQGVSDIVLDDAVIDVQPVEESQDQQQPDMTESSDSVQQALFG